MEPTNLPRPHTSGPDTTPAFGPVVPAPAAHPAVYTITAPDGTVRHVYGPPAEPVQAQTVPVGTPQQAPAPAPVPAVSPRAVSAALYGVAFAGAAGGLLLLVPVLHALTALIMSLVALAAVLLGAAVVAQMARSSRRREPGSQVTITGRRVVVKNSRIKG